MTHVIFLSGGKDSTAMALRLREVELREYIYVCTPTGDELPEMECHWQRLEGMLESPIIRLKNPEFPTLQSLIDHFKCLPGFRMRWCTRILKLETAQEFYGAHQPVTAYVGLRADEEKRRGGLFGDLVTQRYPLREWGWGLREVLGYLRKRKVTIPRRTDCARCFNQRLEEWWYLWRFYPSIYQDAARQEREIGHTFRSPTKGDGWPAALEELGKEFKRGRLPRGAGQLRLWENPQQCRVCSL